MIDALLVSVLEMAWLVEKVLDIDSRSRWYRESFWLLE
jgi:hypothetical protein